MMADVLLVVHFLIAAFIVLGLLAVWLGAALGWPWVRNPWFRYLHVAAIAFVAAEAVLGIACPLTVWEDLLRGGARAESFIGRWVRALLFYQAPEWVFTAAYVAWTLATLATLRLVPPRANRKAL
jgi:polyferredoxin